MLIQVNTDATIKGKEKLVDEVKDAVTNALTHFSERISRVEVHLADEDGRKHGEDDVRCMMEARVEGRQPTAVTHHASSLDEAVDGAAEKLRRSLESALGRAEDRKGRDTVRNPS